uniref:Uncharacterized protein n=1 Tax=Nanning Tombu tick virus 1 TaxID=2972341 RepID=A0A9E7V1Z3_9TOMB|nr:MAG: hypothetical protein [Nanning Tombu tick virus 1]
MTQNFSAKQNAERLHGSALPLAGKAYVSMYSPVVVAGSNTHHTSNKIAQPITVNFNFYSATVIIRNASESKVHPSNEGHPGQEATETEETIFVTPVGRRPPNPRSASERSRVPQPEARARPAGVQNGSARPFGRDEESFVAPTVCFAPQQHPMAKRNRSLLSEVGAPESADLVRAKSLEHDERHDFDGRPLRLQGRYPDITPVTNLDKGSSEGSAMGQIHSILPKISNLRLRK